ncbi:S-adenosyl-L-methionine-dependent methyltransferase [Gigaspora margarita]|uniref:S-adenosyl-L-methionine-dependent methyltransferase n=1 Tax=Gigaspora margarita TaxID=4874 RepID=A0A8H3XHC7_GIGMA|nr:S-adenosyl-L-methionine-dependent methyltransferase [Gigaspora margarita]
MSKKSKNSLINASKNEVWKHDLDSSNFETNDINELTSLLLDSYKTYNGRQFLNDDDLNCLLPSDKIVLERSTLSYLLMRHRWKGNFCSPVKEKLNTSGTTILDIGCGSGLWAIDMGLNHPSSSIIAIDIDPSKFPSKDQCPPNVCFLTCNAIYGIPFPQNTFDFVNISMMWSAFTEAQWILIIKDLVRVLKHNGWIEFTEPDPTLRNGVKNLAWLIECLSNACRDITGVNIHIYEEIPKYIRAMDELEDFNCMHIDYPMGEWYGYFGKYALENLKRTLQSVVFLPKYMKMSNEEFNNLLDDYFKEANEFKISFTVYKYFAKKVSKNVPII